jgi:hypothetical protein
MHKVASMPFFPDGDPVVLHISQDQKARILARLPAIYVQCDLDTGNFMIAHLPHVLFAVWQTPAALPTKDRLTLATE